MRYLLCRLGHQHFALRARLCELSLPAAPLPSHAANETDLIILKIPGLIHSWYIIAKFPEPSYEYEGPADSEGLSCLRLRS